MFACARKWVHLQFRSLIVWHNTPPLTLTQFNNIQQIAYLCENVINLVMAPLWFIGQLLCSAWRIIFLQDIFSFRAVFTLPLTLFFLISLYNASQCLCRKDHWKDVVGQLSEDKIVHCKLPDYGSNSLFCRELDNIAITRFYDIFQSPFWAFLRTPPWVTFFMWMDSLRGG